VTIVIDSGLARVARFDARHGVNALRVQGISQAAAEQRAGRAGRTAPGRCIRLWSNPGELVLSPFAGIGSEGYEAIRLGRRYLGIELKPEYARVAVENLRVAESKRTQGHLFAHDEADARVVARADELT